MAELKIIEHENLQNIIAVLVGTRPGIIKMSPLIKELKRRQINFFVIHAGQHYSYNMDKIMFEQIKIDQPKYILKNTKKYKLHGAQTAEMLKGIEKILIEEKPKILLVCGDANFNFAGALAARKLGIMVGHVESGLRSNDWKMPEEHNRVMIDHISEYLFTPTEENKNNLLKDNVKGKIYVTGNIIVDSVFENLKIALSENNILNKFKLDKKKYILITIHREENVDNYENINNILKGLNLICEKYKEYKFIFPIHPRTLHRITLFKIKNLRVIKPIGYLEFLNLLNNSKIVITDSGGVQEEACILKIPCVTVRNNTERPETVEIGANILSGTKSNNLLKSVGIMMDINIKWENPYGDGTTSKKIVNILINEVLN